MKSYGSSSNGIIVFHADDIILRKPLWITAGQKKLTEMAYKMINVMKHSAADFHEFKASTVERIG